MGNLIYLLNKFHWEFVINIPFEFYKMVYYFDIVMYSENHDM